MKFSSSIITIIVHVFSLCFVKHANGDALFKNDLCEIPNLPVFDKDFQPLTDYNYTACDNKPELYTYTTLENGTARLHINQNAIKYYGQELDCCFSYVTREGSEDRPDDGVSISDCQPLGSKTVELERDTVMVKCFNRTSGLNYPAIYENIHQTIKPTCKTQKQFEKAQLLSKRKPVSVLFVVIDSVSRLNFIRTMPKTRGYIMENGFYEMKAYNKIHDNTFPNFVAWLTGMNKTTAYEICKPTTVDGMSNCPTIWKDYEQYGYVTAYAEDWPRITTFNYNELKGFKVPPTEYYFKPYFDALQMLTIRYQDHYMPFCAGPESQGERVLNLVRNFTDVFRDQPYFGVFWMNTFSHNDINATARMDEKFQQFFYDLKQNGVLNESIVVLLSDHGIRFGNIIGTARGFFEERLPMNYISLPQWFKEDFPAESDAFNRNSLKLTSTYDLYATLQDILILSGFNHTLKKPSACPECSSLFQNLPDNRTCISAGITEEWCSCIGEFQPHEMVNATDFNNAVQKVVDIINKKQTMDDEKVFYWYIDKIFKTPRIRNVFTNDSPQSYYLVLFNVLPHGKFQVLLREDFEIVQHRTVPQ